MTILAARPTRPTSTKLALIDIVVPVYNEAADLEQSVRALDTYLSDALPYRYRITIADNASVDGTWDIAQRLVDTLPTVEAVHLEQKGRGRALKQVWLASDADVVAYMDVDLSTDLAAVLPLVAPLVSGHSDVAIGTRLARTSRVVRGPKRELISRCYNFVLRTALQASFSDAQCGFKAMRRDVAHRLLPLVEDTNWFFDTELLVLAQQADLRIHEVPVDWVDDPGTTVDIVATAKEDLSGVTRLLRGFAAGSIPVARVRAELASPGLVPPTVPGVPRGLLGQVLRFVVVGVMSTIAYFVLYVLLRDVMEAQVANLVAQIVTAVANTAANRAFTFRVHGSRGLLKHHATGLLAFAIAVVLTSGSLWALLALAPGVSTWVEVIVLTLANLVATLVRFLALRFVIGRKADTRP